MKGHKVISNFNYHVCNDGIWPPNLAELLEGFTSRQPVAMIFVQFFKLSQSYCLSSDGTM